MGRASAPPRGSPFLPTGLIMMASTANCAPCQKGKPLHTASMRLAFCKGIDVHVGQSDVWATRAPE